MEQKDVKRNIAAFAWFQILSEPLFWGPVLIAYITNVGKMPLSQVYFMEAIVVFALIFVEIYSSAWADLLGRKRALFVGSFINLVAIILFVMVDSPLLVWVSNILIMVGFAILSGVDEAFLVDTLKDAGRYGEYTKINGRISSRRYLVAALSCIASGYLYSLNPRLPMILAVPGVAVSLVSVLFLHESRVVRKKVQIRFGWKKFCSLSVEHFRLMKQSVLFVKNHKALKWIIGYTTLLAVASKLWFFTYNPYFELVKLDEKFYGWIFFGMNLIAWSTSKYAHRIEKRAGEQTLIIVMLALVSIPIFLMGALVSQTAIVFVFFQNFVRGFQEPFFSTFTNQHLDTENRATVLSINSAVRALICAACLWIFGLILKNHDLGASLQILGFAALTLGIFTILKYRQIFRT